jgi:hypothetical protein
MDVRTLTISMVWKAEIACSKPVEYPYLDEAAWQEGEGPGLFLLIGTTLTRIMYCSAVSKTQDPAPSQRPTADA